VVVESIVDTQSMKAIEEVIVDLCNHGVHFQFVSSFSSFVRRNGRHSVSISSNIFCKPVSPSVTSDLSSLSFLWCCTNHVI